MTIRRVFVIVKAQALNKYLEEEKLGTKKTLTFGQKYAGVGFNPSGNEDVDIMKNLYADVIDTLNEGRAEIGGHHAEDATGDPEAGEKSRLYSIAITKAQDAQMWAVKAITYGQ